MDLDFLAVMKGACASKRYWGLQVEWVQCANHSPPNSHCRNTISVFFSKRGKQLILKWLIPFARAFRKTWNSRLAYWRKESLKIKKLFFGKIICAKKLDLQYWGQKGWQKVLQGSLPLPPMTPGSLGVMKINVFNLLSQNSCMWKWTWD